MNGKEFLAAEHVHGANNTPLEIARATDTVNAYAYRHTDTTRAADQRAAELVDELGLNGRPMQTSRHRKTKATT